jgi:myo-inositol 2-dehydrogenase / D-chiro-inositol 1-dehydrogenase
MATRLKVGIIGAGRIGTVHARTIVNRVPEAAVAVIADPVRGLAEKLAAELGIPRVAADHREILRDPAIDAVLVCSSTDTHAAVVIEAARAGKQIFCEKPLDLDLARIDTVLEAVAKAGVKLMMGFNRRFDPDFAHVRSEVARGAVGRPHLLRITSRDPGPPPIEYVKVSGGMFMDMTIHDFDMARFVMGREVEEVYAATGVLVDPAIGEVGDVDTAIVTLRFAGGAIGAIDNSRRAVYGYDQRVEVFGTGGMVANANHSEHTVSHADAAGIHAPLPLNFFMQRYAAAYEAEIRAFVECVAKGTQPPVGGADARAATVIAYAALRSAKEQRPVATREVEG